MLERKKTTRRVYVMLYGQGGLGLALSACLMGCGAQSRDGEKHDAEAPDAEAQYDAEASDARGKPKPDSGKGKNDPQPEPDSAADKKARQDFLGKTPIQKAPDFEARYVLGTKLAAFYDLPASPIVHPYNWSPPITVLSTRFPEAFRKNLPPEILRVLAQYKLRTLDLLFTPQAAEAGELLLRVHYWADPTFKVGFKGNPAAANGTFLMGIFAPEHKEIAHQVKEGMLSPFSVSAHGGLISPNNAQLGRVTLPTTFYSVVMDPSKTRGAVTLHALFDQERFSRLMRYGKGDAPINEAIPGPAFKTLSALLKELENDAVFKSSSMLRYLKELTRI